MSKPRWAAELSVSVSIYSGGVGAEVEQTVVVVEGERDGGVLGEGVVVEAEHGGEVGVLQEHMSTWWWRRP